ncbi:MAG: hypothetical protein KGL97_17505 [Alphaproteobacteria bacterium]|nr:hypothetical protein [Alphaproteobacteria bacterium]
MSHAFYVGDGIQTVLLDGKGKIWIGYFDEGVFGAFNPMPPEGHLSYRYGPSGLVRCDDRGNVEFSYNTQHPERSISDIQAMTLDEADWAWFCPYTDFFLATTNGGDVNYVLPRAPVSLEDALSVGPEYFAFFGGYQRSSMIAIVHRASQRLRLIQLHKPNGDTLSPVRFATRGARAIAVSDDNLFRLDHQVLLGALGPWTDANTSDVASAVQYLNEEESYSDSYLISPGNGAERVSGKPRPNGNPPRHDKDTGL